jgi:hypothetical protein
MLDLTTAEKMTTKKGEKQKKTSTDQLYAQDATNWSALLTLE